MGTSVSHRNRWVEEYALDTYSAASAPELSTSSSSITSPPPVVAPARFVAFPFAYRQEIELVIETLTNRGWGLGRYTLPSSVVSVTSTAPAATAPAAAEQADSTATGLPTSLADATDNDDVSEDSTASTTRWVVMVPNVIPGERVRVAVFRNFNNYSEADLVTVLEPSPDRVVPHCPLAADCGGCQLQHVSIESQRRWKTTLVQEGLAQYGLTDVTVAPTLGTDQTYGYRSKLTPHYDAPAKQRRGRVEPESVAAINNNSNNNNNNNNKKMIEAIGFQKMTSRKIINVETCPIATPAINAKYQQTRQELMSQPSKRKKGATLLFRQGNADDDYVETNHQQPLTTTVRGLNFTYLAGNFFQNNYYVLPLMVEHVLARAVGDDHEQPTMTHLADCYCGSGLFAIAAAPSFATVVGIEINDKAVREAQANAERNGIDHCQFLAASSENIFAEIRDFPRDTTVVVLDPPRKGCSVEFLSQLYDFAPRRIVYMSCDPTTQARDAQGIVAAGYRITSVQPFDLFPQTRHIECLMVLERSPAPGV
jgi:tRNA (uracil-5-)-methyltransferase